MRHRRSGRSLWLAAFGAQIGPLDRFDRPQGRSRLTLKSLARGALATPSLSRLVPQFAIFDDDAKYARQNLLGEISWPMR